MAACVCNPNSTNKLVFTVAPLKPLMPLAHGFGWGHRGIFGLALMAVSTRRLIIAALLCGVAILVAFTVQLMLVR